MTTAPPRPGPLAAMTTLEDIAIVTYDIDPDALAEMLPEWIVPDVLTLGDGRRRALVSAVSFRDVDFRFPVRAVRAPGHGPRPTTAPTSEPAASARCGSWAAPSRRGPSASRVGCGRCRGTG